MYGFDIGTTHCKASYLDAAGKPTIIPNSRGEPTTPSAVYRAADGQVLIGRDAIEQGVVDPHRLARSFKLKLGSTESVMQDGEPMTPTDATVILIEAMIADAERATAKKVEEAVVTCPANFRDDQKQALKDAFERCGVRVLRLMPEPTAAGVAYSEEKGTDRSTIAVYDIGGGTFDVSLLQKDGPELRVLATDGVSKLGGNDLTELIVQHVLDQIEQESGERPEADQEPLLFLDLWQRAESAKRSLATQAQVPIVLSWQGRQFVIPITQERFHQSIDPLIDQTLEALDRVLAATGLDRKDISRLILVGGTSRIPYIQSRVADHTGLVSRVDIDPDKAIAYGAALACTAELAREGRHATIRGQVIPAPDVWVRDVTAHGVGCCVIDPDGSGRLSNAVIIPKNTPIPCRRSDRFALEHEDQVEARIEILQGEDNAARDDCLLIGELVLTNLPKETARTKRIAVEYVIDSDGMVAATATDSVSGAQQAVSVDYKRGLTQRGKPAAA